MSAAPLTYTWSDDGTFRPMPHLSKLADKLFVVGLKYQLEVIEQRSKRSHDHFFAVVDEAWASLPEIHANRWREPDDLRAWALIQAGFCNESTFIMKSHAEALRTAACMGSLNGRAEIEVQGNLIAHRTAKSQLTKQPGGMSAKEFQASKQGVLEVLAKLIEVPVEVLAKQGNAA